MVVGCMPELVRVGGPRRLLNLADAGGLGVEADYVFVAAIGEEFAIYFAGAADGFIGGGALGSGAVGGIAEIYADFVF